MTGIKVVTTEVGPFFRYRETRTRNSRNTISPAVQASKPPIFCCRRPEITDRASFESPPIPVRMKMLWHEARGRQGANRRPPARWLVDPPSHRKCHGLSDRVGSEPAVRPVAISRLPPGQSGEPCNSRRTHRSLRDDRRRATRRTGRFRPYYAMNLLASRLVCISLDL